MVGEGNGRFSSGATYGTRAASSRENACACGASLVSVCLFWAQSTTTLPVYGLAYQRGPLRSVSSPGTKACLLAPCDRNNISPGVNVSPRCARLFSHPGGPPTRWRATSPECPCARRARRGRSRRRSHVRVYSTDTARRCAQARPRRLFRGSGGNSQ